MCNIYRFESQILLALTTMEELRSEPICKRAQHLTHDIWNFFSSKFSLPMRRRRGAFARSICRPSSSLACSTYLSNRIFLILHQSCFLQLDDSPFVSSLHHSIWIFVCTILVIARLWTFFNVDSLITHDVLASSSSTRVKCVPFAFVSLDYAWDFNSTDNLSQHSTRKVGKTNWMELCTGLSSALELFPRKTNIQHMMVFLQIRIFVSSASIVCSNL